MPGILTTPCNGERRRAQSSQFRPAGRLQPAGPARAARLTKFKREQLVVDYLNRGVSVAEIAARVGVGEKRMRAVIREILARRMPAPPEEFVAIQVSRLNEALLVAFSAMSPTNLKAVGQVVKIVRELDRYGGAFAAEWRRPEASGLDARADEDAAFASAWLYGAEPALQNFEAASPGSGGDDRPENLAQRLEKVESAPGFAATSAVAARLSTPRDPTHCIAPEHEGRESPPAASAGDGRSQNQPQGLEKVESAPGIAASPETSELAAQTSPLQDVPPFVAPRHEGGDVPLAASPGDKRPQNPAQDLGKVESTLGHGWLAQAA